MKNITKLISVITAAVLLQACRPVTGTELGNRLITEAIGIDVVNGITEITVQALDVNGGTEEANRVTAKLYNFEGTSTGEALSDSFGYEGLIPLFSQTRVLIIGEKTAENGVMEILDFFLRERTVRSNVSIAVAKGKASDVINADISKNRLSAEIIENGIYEGSRLGKNVYMPLFKFVNYLLSPTDCGYCPVIEVVGNDNSDNKSVEITGTAFFRDDKLLTEVDTEATAGFLFLKGEADSMTVTVPYRSGNLVFKTVKQSVHYASCLKNGKIQFTVNTKAVFDMDENSVSAVTETASADNELMQSLLKEAVEQKEKRALENIFLKNRCDICRFGRKILLKYPEFYESYIQSMPELTEYNFTTDITIRRTGKLIAD